MTENIETLEQEAPVAAPEEAKPLTREEAERLFEAILFAAGYPMSYEKLGNAAGVSAGKAKELVEEMALHYADPAENHGIQLLAMKDSAQLCTREQYAPQIREALGIRSGGNLSNSSVEVLATIAYNQPVTRAYVDTVRGVDSAYAINSLTLKGLIEPCGRLDAPGRPILYRTTKAFLRCFGLLSLDDLPEIAPPPETLVENEHDGIIEHEENGVIETRLSFTQTSLEDTISANEETEAESETNNVKD